MMIIIGIDVDVSVDDVTDDTFSPITRFILSPYTLVLLSN